MPWGRFEQIPRLDAAGLKSLNDMIRYLFQKVQGGLTRKELSSGLQNVIDSKAEAAAVNALGETVGEHASQITQNAAQIALRVSRAEYTQDKIYRGDTPPEAAAEGSLWLDTSAAPELLKKYNGTQWVVVGTDTLKTAGISIAAEGLALNGPAVDIRTQQMAVNIVDADSEDVTRVGIDAHGVAAERMTADELHAAVLYEGNTGRALRLPPGTYTFYVRPDGDDNAAGSSWDTAKRTIQSVVDSLPKWLDGASVTISLYNGYNYNEDVVFSGFYGTGDISLFQTNVWQSFANVNSVTVNSCSCRVAMRFIIAKAVTITRGGPAHTMWACKIHNTAANAVALKVELGAKMTVSGSDFVAHTGISANALSRVLSQGNTGSCTVAYSADGGAEVVLTGTGLTGTQSKTNGGQITGSATATASPGASAAPGVTATTVQIALAASRTWRASQWYGDGSVHDIGYGDYGYGIQTGCMWFNASALAAIKGKTVVSARLRFTRRNGIGSSAAETITVYALGSPASRPAGSWAGSPAAVKTGTGATTANVPRGTAAWLTVAPADAQLLVNGTAAGLCLYTGSTGYGKGDGYGTANAPVLEITYK